MANSFLDGGEGEKLQHLLESRASRMSNWVGLSCLAFLDGDFGKYNSS